MEPARQVHYKFSGSLYCYRPYILQVLEKRGISLLLLAHGNMIFLICSILASIELQIGLALGLFAIFAIIRFRTVAFSVKDMTYMFNIIGISIINSQANIPPPVIGALVVNATIIILTYALEKFLQKKVMERRTITINKLELLRPERSMELLRELSLLTGLNVESVLIERIDFDRNRAELEIFFKGDRLHYENPYSTGRNSTDTEVIIKEADDQKVISQ